MDDDRKIYVVADGIGGGCRGDVASRIAVDGILDYVNDNIGTPSLEGAVHNAQTHIYRAMREDETLRGMGTTVVSLLLEDNDRAMVAHVGDSRAYRLRAGRLRLLTRDHTLAGEFTAGGHLSTEEAADHPFNHLLTRALSREPDLQVDTCPVSVRDGDVFLLCSDGLTKMLAHSEILSCMEAGGGAEAMCGRLVRRAIEHGGADNITVLVVEVS